MIALSFLLASLQHFIEIDSNYDLLFEGNTLFIVVYLYFVARDEIESNGKLKLGMWILLFNKFYDVLTEITFFDSLADRYEFIDTFLEDGLLQLSFLIIALGLTEIIREVKDNAAKDELTGLYNRKMLGQNNHLEVFDLIYFDLDGLKLVNDMKGHHVGDLMIIRFSQALHSCLNELNLAYRVGGDEFIVITEVGEGDKFVSCVKRTLDGENISFSYGIEKATTQESFNEALVKTDKAMYKMKNSQRKS